LQLEEWSEQEQGQTKRVRVTQRKEMTKVMECIRIIVVAIFKSDLSVSEAIKKNFLSVHVTIDCWKLGVVIDADGLFDTVESSNGALQGCLAMKKLVLERRIG